MSLTSYWQKRNFKATPEPKGKITKQHQQLTFVIQKHAASHLHYDFRLEFAGTLKSWAIPKGPSLNPADKRLAAEVEDHPLAYANFEGTIPKGHYGAGEVIIWDKGYWIPKVDPELALQNGRLKFTLVGEKLQGTWNLVRMPNKRSSANNWLLIKERDEYADTHKDITAARPESIISGKLLSAKTTANKPKKTSKSATELPMIKPQLATLVDSIPVGDQWLHEVKYDGYRVLCYLNQGQVRLITRNQNDWTPQFAELATIIKQLKVENAILDGEVVAMLDEGLTDFQALQNALAEHNTADLIYYAFDLLFLNDHDLRALPLIQRKELLHDLLATQPTDSKLRYSDHIQGDSKQILLQACQIGLEGIISKKINQPYSAGRSETWVKTKCIQRQEFIICGFTEPVGARTSFGALLLGYYDDQNNLCYAGKVGTGFTLSSLQSLLKKLAPLKCTQSPFSQKISLRHITWVKPTLLAEITFTGWTRDKRLRHPSFQGLREDKEATEVHQEIAKPISELAKNKHFSIEGVNLSHPAKILYPKQQISKKDIALLYAELAPWLLPYVTHCPLSILRCTESINAKCFYQKHASASMHEAIQTMTLKYKQHEAKVLFITEITGLLALVQMGVIEIHPWLNTINNAKAPRQIIFDLDPDPALPWKKVKEAAWIFYNVLTDLKLTSFLKTTGGKGLHIALPIEVSDWQEAHRFAKKLAQSIAQLAPKQFTANTLKAMRKDKIFIDYLRNSFGATAVAPYSIRAREYAPIAMPISWDELSELGSADYFRFTNTLAYLKNRISDPWQAFFTIKQTLPALNPG